MERAYLIDGTAFCYRAFYAIRSLSTSDGRPTNAVYGFARMLHALEEKAQPDYLAVAFDVGKPTFRHRQFEAYKIQRKPMPDPLIAQVPVVKQLLAAYRIPVFEQEGYEAEDVLATIAKRIVRDGLSVVLVTGDKDALQLVNGHITVYNPHKDLVLDANAVRDRYGVGPERMVDLMALMGDEIDNIPGVPGIGEKTAIQLLQRFGSLDGLYDHLEDLESPARRSSLTAAREQVALARELARIESEIPLEVELNALKRRPPDWRALRGLFRALEFKQLLRAVEAHGPAQEDPTQMTHVVTDPRLLKELLSRLSQGGPTAVSLGCWAIPLDPPGNDQPVLLALAEGPSDAWVVGVDRAALETPEGEQLAAWLANPGAPKVSHDAKRAKRLLGRLGVTLQGIAGDTMLAAYLLKPSRTSQTLNDLSDEYLGQFLSPLPALSGLPKSGELDPTPWALYGASACTVLRLHAQLVSRLEDLSLIRLYRELELPLVEVLADMEAAGVAIDRTYLASVRSSMDVTLTQLTEEIYRLAGCTFNLNSPKQLAHVLFESLQLPVVKRTKTGPSTDSEVLQQLAERHPLPRQLMQYRELSKLISTYLDALPNLIDPATGRIHTSFNQTATATGRLSSSEPNLQNIPIKTALGRSIRKAFIPGLRDGVLVSADYSQIELRILAHVSSDEQLTEAFRQGRDIHRVTASLIYGIPEQDVQPEQRNAMKAVNFGILYGMTSHGLSKELGISFEEAQAFIEAYFARYPKVRGYLERQIVQAKQDGFVQTLLGRRRDIPELASADVTIRQLGERMAINTPIQGTAADLIKQAMIQVAAQLQVSGLRSRMLLQVHDELVFETPRPELNAFAELARSVMEGAITLNVPLAVTVKAGPSWLDLAPV